VTSLPFDPAGLAQAERVRQLRQAWVEDLSRLPWSHFATLTTRYESSAERLLNECRRYARRLERMAQGPVHWFAAAEGLEYGWPHVHMLITGAASLSRAQLARWWTLGQTRIRRYAPGGGAIAYTVKGIGCAPDAPECHAFRLPPIYSRRK
jgi:hypothetical protein